MSLNITIPDTFNGPLDLLYSLIVRDEMDIYDIPIAKLTASYCAEIEKMEVVDIDEGAEFLDLASRLKDIKLRMLLPPEERLDDEEDGDDFDPRSSLVEALLEYRRFKDAARLLSELAEEQARRYPRVSPRLELRAPPPENDDGADVMQLFMAIQSMLDKLVGPQIIESHEIPISTRIEQIEDLLTQKESARFSLLLSSNPDRKEIVAFFIAILELIRRGLLHARQADNYSDIILVRREPERTAPRAVAKFAGNRASACFPAAFHGTARGESETRARRKPPPVFPPPVPLRRKAVSVPPKGVRFPAAAPSRKRRRA